MEATVRAPADGYTIMTVSRNREGGKALMVLSLDTAAAPDVLERLGVGVDDAYLVGADLAHDG